MRILAIFAEKTLPLQRRVVAPYSVLSERGHACHFMQTPALDPEIALTYDLVVLPNVVPDEPLLARFASVAAQGGRFVYDLSEPLLLKEQSVQALIALCGAVFVPTAFLAQQVSTLLRGRAAHLSNADGRTGTRVYTIPSVVDRHWLFQGNNPGQETLARVGQQSDINSIRHQYNSFPKYRDIVIGCLGNQGEYDWEEVVPDLLRIVQHYKNVHLLCHEASYAVFEREELLRPIIHGGPLSPETYPIYVGICTFGLCPRSRLDGRETVGALEYGILHKPVIASALSYSRVFRQGEAYLVGPTGKDTWYTALADFIRDIPLCAETGHAAFERANRSRTSQAADRFLAALRENLPQGRLAR